MWVESKNDDVVMRAVKLQTQGRLSEAAALFQRAGNQYRSPAEKETLWNAAKRVRELNSQG
jgi:hypothetical protein